MSAIAKQNFYFAAGLGLMALAWAKHRLSGYTTPSSIDTADPAASAAYVRDVVDDWLRFLPAGVSLRDRDVLELCPGASLGTGALLLALGARSYHAVDKFRLVTDAPDMAAHVLKDLDARFAPADVARAAAIIAEGGLTYRADLDFDIRALAGMRHFDLMVSYVALEHFEALDHAVAQMTALARPGCVAVHMIDFRTHTRWIRERDPNNIYRYPSALYRLFGFSGQHNRLRPADYVRAFEAAGWRDVRVVPADLVPEPLRAHSLSGLGGAFRGPENRMDMLAGVLLATRP